MRMFKFLKIKPLFAGLAALQSVLCFGADVTQSLSNLVYGWSYEVEREYKIHQAGGGDSSAPASGAIKAIVTIDKKGRLHTKAADAKGVMVEELMSLDRGYINFG